MPRYYIYRHTHINYICEYRTLRTGLTGAVELHESDRDLGLQRFRYQLGPSQMKLDFKIEAQQYPTVIQPTLSVIVVKSTQYKWKIGC